MLHESSFDQMAQSARNLRFHHLIEARAERNPASVAIVAPNRTPLTFRALSRQIDETIRRLHAMGICRGDRVAIVLPNGPEMLVAFIAVAAMATSAPLNPAYLTSEFEFYLSDLKAKALITQPDLNSSAVATAQAHGIPVIELSPVREAPSGTFTLNGNVGSSASSRDLAQADDTALVLHTSGTTSRPKIVPLSHRNICASALNIGTALQLKASDRCLNVMPLFHVHGLVSAALSSLAAGASVVCAPGFYAPLFFDWLAEFRPTWYTAVPTIYQAILARALANRETIALSRLRLIRSASAALPPQVMTELEEVFNAPVIEAYGMTEAAHQMTSNPLPPRERKKGSVGVAAGPEVAIMDDRGDLLPPGEAGEIVIRGSNVMQGYEDNSAANNHAFVKGWFRTGDQGYMDPDGYLYIKGRLKEIINRGGEKISPREIDEVLMDHPCVAQAVAFAAPHATLGEEVMAAVVLHNKGSITEKELREFAATRLAYFKVPRQVILLDEIPKGPTGKLQRIGLAEKLCVSVPEESKIEAARNFIAPRNSFEEMLAKLFAQTLGLERVSIYDDFFQLGGDSILATLLASRVREAMHVDLSIASIFETTTVAGLALVIETALMESDEIHSAENSS